MKIFVLVIFCLSLLSCGQHDKIAENLNKATNSDGNSSIDSEQVGEPTSSYPGVTIDQKFGIIEYRHFLESDLMGRVSTFSAGGFEIEFKGFAPQQITRKGKTALRIKKRESEYTSLTVGTASLTGDDSKQIFILTHTGAVCCSSFWLIDISNGKPSTIFQSEDYDYYRGGMEIFDANHDGIYELSLFDSSFRYILDDCGSCSPEPRAVFKYDKKKRKYLPSTGIQQEFVLESFREREQWFAETFEKMKDQQNLNERYNFHRGVRAFTVDLLYFGDERRAWRVFDKYYPLEHGKKDNRAEIKKIFNSTKFHLTLKARN